jgi:UDP-N-acetylmuramoylalanine--D-glutamate ligase
MTDQFSFAGKRVTVFGLGVSGGGVGTVEFLVRQGAADIRVTDAKHAHELAESVAKIEHLPGVRLFLGEHRKADFTEVDMVIKNPRIPWTNEYIQMAREANVPVEMDSSIFFALCDKPIIGVTGTKGKTTTASAIAHLLRVAGKRVLEVGIGETPVLSLVEKISECDVVVFELSSWRLSALASVRKSPHIAVFTNFYPDHLNYYSSMEEYFTDKANIVRFQNAEDVFVYNAESPELVREAGRVLSRKIFFARDDREGDGVFVREGDLVCREGKTDSVFATLADIRIPGKHNVGNVMAAIAAARAFGVGFELIAKGLLSFSGVPHRLEFVVEKKNALWYNDSAATIPDAAIAGIRSFETSLVLLAGGSDKNLDFDELGKTIAEAWNVKGVVLFSGDATEKLIAAIRAHGGESKILGTVSSMNEAITLATSHIEPKDIVLLSPGAASFGLFQNEFDRGNQFREMVGGL